MGFAAIPCLSYRIELHSIPPASLGLQDGVILPATIVIVVGFRGSEARAAYAQCHSSNANCLCGWNSA
jgi:hypothetical protein